MLRKQSQYYRSLLFLADCALLSACWLGLYYVRFTLGWPLPVTQGVPDFNEYLACLLFVPPVWGTIFRAFDLYRPRRLDSRRREAFTMVKASSLATLGILGASWMLYKMELSRLFLGCFWVASTAALMLSRIAFREGLRYLRRRGYNQRSALIVGTGPGALAVQERLHRHPELGFRLEGYVSPRDGDQGERLRGIPIIGHVDDLLAIVRERRPGQLFVMLDGPLQPYLEDILDELEGELVTVTLVSDLFQRSRLAGTLEDFEGLPILTVNDSAVLGWDRVFKRALDIAVSGAVLLFIWPLLLLIAALVWITSGRPILYRQERMGLDGRTFQLIKFRTMSVDAEAGSGAVWSQRSDPRTTKFGALMRRTSMDELPQLWNVLKGEMSLVGPRPERPVFVREFKQSIPQYMQRHRVKAGLTGWAQINGLRGATSIDERLRHDLFYIENRSLLLDCKILWRTLWGGFLNREL